MPKLKSPSSKKPHVKPRPDGVQWRDAEIKWASGEWTQKAIAQQLGVNSQTVYMHMRKNKIEKGSMQDKIKEIAENQAKLEIETLTKELYEDAFESKKITVKASLALQRLTMSIVKSARDNGRSLESIEGELKSVALAVKTIGEGSKNIFHALGLDKEDTEDQDLPELVVRNLTDERLNEIRQEQEEQARLINGTVEEEDLGELANDSDIEELASE